MYEDDWLESYYEDKFHVYDDSDDSDDSDIYDDLDEYNNSYLSPEDRIADQLDAWDEMDDSDKWVVVEEMAEYHLSGQSDADSHMCDKYCKTVSDWSEKYMNDHPDGV